MHPRDGGPWSAREIDGNFAPGAWRRRDATVPEQYQPEHVACLYHRDGWTMISFWDRSMDHRFSSNGNFIVEGTHDFDTACTLAREVFPSVWDRVAPLQLDTLGRKPGG